MRCAYGSDVLYQNLALDALSGWKAWNEELADESTQIPPGMTHEDTLYVKNGFISVADGSELPEFERLSLKGISEAGYGDSQFVTNQPIDVARAKKAGFGHAINPFYRREKSYTALVDGIGGFVYADKACRFALHKAKTLGVLCVFGKEGTFESFFYASDDENQSKVVGVKTVDGVEHASGLVIVAGGGWTPTIVPEMDALCETTGGSVCFYQIPKTSPLWARFSAENFPTFSVGMRTGAGGGVYGFPRDENGILKIGYRGTKYDLSYSGAIIPSQFANMMD